jgi:hypothetical protein
LLSQSQRHFFSIFQSRTDVKGRFGSDFECDLEICMQFHILSCNKLLEDFASSRYL